ncbi:hypothetical protein J4402_00110 [Candidatus Pacearchaeota archaeon]|nr:hypothetical protein [Candidatus Pacearchaeota archaeon]
MANKEAKLGVKFFGVIVFFALVVFLSLLVVADVTTVLWSPINHTYYNSSEGMNWFYNISINFSDAAYYQNNITQINVTLPINFTFTANSNGTSVNSTLLATGISPIFSLTNISSTLSYLNISQVLSWSNFTHFVTNDTVAWLNNSAFWFNANATTAGWYNVTVSVMNSTGAAYITKWYNLSLRVNDTDAPVVAVPVGNISGATTTDGVTSGGNYSGNLTLNLSFKDDTPAQMIFSITNATTAMGRSINYSGTLNGGFYDTIVNFNESTFVEGLYNITVWLNDSSSLLNKTVIFKNIRVDKKAPVVFNANISVASAGTTNGIRSGGNYSQTVVFNTTAWDANSSVVIWINVTNASNGKQNATYAATQEGGNKNGGHVVTINTTSLLDGIYNISVMANDTAGNNNYSYVSAAKITTIIIDNTAPSITLTRSSSSTKTSLVISASITDKPSNVSGQCTQSFGSHGLMSGSGTSQTFTGSELTCGTSYTIPIRCVDYAGNVGTASITAATDACGTSDSGSSSSSSGGGASTTTWTSTFVADSTELSAQGSVTKSLGGKNRVRLKVSGETHYVGVTSVSGSSATVEVSSTPQTAALNIGETKKFDLASDGYYDLSVTLNSITNGKADITMKAISEKVVVATAPTTTTTEPETTAPPVQTSPSTESGSSVGWIIAIIVIVALIVVGILVAKKKRYF